MLQRQFEVYQPQSTLTIGLKKFEQTGKRSRPLQRRQSHEPHALRNRMEQYAGL